MSEYGIIAAIEPTVPALGCCFHDKISEVLQCETAGHPLRVDLRIN
jgi:hypothetical protein